MKNLRMLIMILVAAVLFGIGISIPGTGTPVHIVFVVAGIALGFIFYLLVFHQVLTTPTLTPGMRILWMILVVCVPIIGNVLFVIIHNAISSRQVVKSF